MIVDADKNIFRTIVSRRSWADKNIKTTKMVAGDVCVAVTHDEYLYWHDKGVFACLDMKDDHKKDMEFWIAVPNKNIDYITTIEAKGKGGGLPREIWIKVAVKCGRNLSEANHVMGIRDIAFSYNQNDHIRSQILDHINGRKRTKKGDAN